MNTNCQTIPNILNEARMAIHDHTYDHAQKCLMRILSSLPDHAEANHLMGMLFFMQNDYGTAMMYLEKAVHADATNIQFLFNYASVLSESGQLSNALKVLKKILDLQPAHIPSLTQCCILLNAIGSIILAEKVCRFIISIDPQNATAYNNLGNILKNQARLEEALTCYRQAMTLQPDFTMAASNYLLCLHYHDTPPEVLFKEHLQWESRILHQSPIRPLSHKPADHASATIRIGYVSADFRDHAVAYFVESILENHDRKNFQIYCYAHLHHPDQVTKRLQEYPAKWRYIYGISDSDVAHMIQTDKIDILVDLAAHSGESRLPVFLHKPAPIQVTYLGYPNTTALSTMDYRLTDMHTDPVGQDQYYTETLYRLPHTFLCYRPPTSLPPIKESPCSKNGYITIGTSNNLFKINRNVIHVWAQILHAVPHAKLSIKNKQFNDQGIKERYIRHFTELGIASSRLAFHPYAQTYIQHLQWYNTIDIALDTFPYNGTTTTCEALIMGRPVITLEGSHHVSRVGVSILKNAGHPEFIARDPDTYINLVTMLSQNQEHLISLHQTIRSEVETSLLCNGKAFTAQLEDAYREMLDQWIEHSK